MDPPQDLAAFEWVIAHVWPWVVYFIVMHYLAFLTKGVVWQVFGAGRR